MKTTGDVLAISLPNGSFAYAKVLEFPLVAFFDQFSSEILPISALVHVPIAFRVWVMKKVVDSRRWKKIGEMPLSADDVADREFFSRDMVSKKLVVHRGHDTIPASIERCSGLELAMVWNQTAIEERLECLQKGELSPIVIRAKKCCLSSNLPKRTATSFGPRRLRKYNTFPPALFRDSTCGSGSFAPSTRPRHAPG
ncbi:MAG: immunity 26/phosphotriesterase HocA family protein [Maricaulis sp.]|nr:immunity 26/phosphotriesterase HocA family protein [Maricaulis sp.]MBO6877815.1 immunity 26/phosphotriesterase HocA family protein [Maricaulis sp.]